VDPTRNPLSYSDPFGLCPEDVGGDGKTDKVTDCPREVMEKWATSHITITARGGTDFDGIDPDLWNAVVWASMELRVSLGISGAKEGGHSIEGRHAVGGAVDINTVNGVRFGAMPFDIAANVSGVVARTISSFLPENNKPIMIYTPGSAFRTTRPMTAEQRAKLLQMHRTHIHITVPGRGAQQ